MDIINKIALILSIVGCVNWGSVGLFKFDIVAWIFGGQASIGARLVYILVLAAGLWCISLFFQREHDYITERVQ